MDCVPSAREAEISHEEQHYDDEVEISKVDMPSVGDKIEIYWPIDDQYYPGIIGNYDEETDKFRVDYTDDDVETLDLRNEQ